LVLVVEADGDQALAAEPGFDGEPPAGGQCAMIARPHVPDGAAKFGEQQPENFALGLPGQAQAVRLFKQRWGR